MKKYLLILLSVFIAISFLGCSAKRVTIKAQLPAQVDGLTKKRNIAVLSFYHDNVNFSDILKSKLGSIIVNGKPYFNIVERNRLDSVKRELNFQSSDLAGGKRARFGRMIGAQVLIMGGVRSFAKDGSYRAPRQQCSQWDKKGNCLRYKTVYETCKTSNASLTVSIYSIDVETGAALDSVNIIKSYSGDSCKDRGTPSLFGLGGSKEFKVSRMALNDLVNEAATDYVNRVAPHFVNMQIVLIEDVKSVDLTSSQEKRFKQALKYIEHGRIDAAEMVLDRLNQEVRQRSYEIAYDLGVTKEALGKLEDAQMAYNLADRIIMQTGADPSEQVDEAIERINRMLQDRKKLKSQLR